MTSSFKSESPRDTGGAVIYTSLADGVIQPIEDAFDADVDAEIEKWVAAHLATSPEWGEERWASLGDLLGVDFTARSA